MMYRKNLFLLMIAGVFLLGLLTACNKLIESPLEEQEEQSTNNDGTDTLAENSSNHEDASDYTWNDADVIPIILNGTSITANTTGASVNGTTLTITSAGTYSLTGALTNGQIIIDADDEAVVRVIFNEINITNTTNAPVFIKNSDKTIIVLADNTENTLTDGSTYIFENTSVDEPNAALFSSSDLTIFGNGSLLVYGNYNDAISSKDGLIIRGADITVKSADDGIRGKDYLIIKTGNIVVNASGDGLKADNSEDATKGYIQIEGGNLDITSGRDGLAAETDAIINDGTITIISGGGSNKKITGSVSAKGIKGNVSVTINGGIIDINSADDGLHSNEFVSINDGTISISTADDGIHADAAIKIANGDVNIIKSLEGIEAPIITVSDGNVSIVASDDGFNATHGHGGEMNDGSYLNLNGGNIYVNTSRGDGLDSNGNIVMTTGTVVVHGPQSSPEVGTDYNGTFKISGGVLIITGPNSGHMIEATSTSSEQYSVKATSNSQVSASTLFHVQDADGNDVITFKPVRRFYYIVFSTSALKKGVTYNIYTGGTSTGTNNNGLYTGGTYSGGTFRKSFTITGSVTNVSF